MRKSKLFRMSCFVFVGIFFYISQAWAVNSVPGKTNNSVQAASIEQLLKLKIPSGWGIIKDSYDSGTDKLIVNIQDAHCDFEAQQNIARILNRLALNYKLKVVAIEGASGKVENPLLENFPDKKVRGDVSLDLVKQGRLTGAEYLAVNSDYDLKLYGVEDMRLYMDNLAAFQQSQPFKKEARMYFAAIKKALDMLKEQIYNPDLKKLDSLENDYASRKISFDKYAIELYKLIEENGLRKVNYPLFYALQDAIKLELNVDFKKADTERMQLITILTQVIDDKQTITSLVDKSLDFKKGMISAGDFANFLKDLAFEKKVSLSGFPNFNAYADYITKYEQVANEDLFVEITTIDKDLKKVFYTDDDQKQLDVLYEKLDILVKLVDLKMENQDIAYFFKNRGQINSDSFTKFIEPQSYKHKVVVSLPTGMSYLDVYIPAWAKFYELADTRDSAFIEKTLAHMDKDNTDYAALITGGFHTKQLTRLLKEKKISYVVIAPKASVDGENPYFNLLQGGKTEIEQFLSSRQSTLALLKPTSDPSALENLAPAEQKNWKAKAQEEQNDQTFQLAVGAFASIASANPESSDAKIQGAVITIFENMNTKMTDSGQKPVVDMAYITPLVKDMHRQKNDNQETSSVVIKSGGDTIVFNPEVAPGAPGRIAFNSETPNNSGNVAGTSVLVASVNPTNVSSQTVETPAAVNRNSDIIKVTPQNVVDKVVSSSAETNDPATAVRISAIAEKVIPALTFTGSVDVDAIEGELKGTTGAGVMTSKPPKEKAIFNVAGLKGEIQKVVAATESLILENSSSAENAAVIAVGEKGLNLKLTPESQEKAVTIIKEALIKEGDYTSMLTSISGQLVDKKTGISIVVDKQNLANALNTGLAGAYTAETHSGDIVAKTVISKLSISDPKKMATVTAIIKDNTTDTKTKTTNLAASLKADPKQVSEALFSGLKQANVAANPIVNGLSSVSTLSTKSQEAFIASKIKSSDIQNILSKAEKTTAPEGQFIVFQGAQMDDSVLAATVDAGVDSSKVSAVVIAVGAYPDKEAVSVKIKPIENGRVYIEISPKKSEAILNPQLVAVSLRDKE
jgi:hypothetical protein